MPKIDRNRRALIKYRRKHNRLEMRQGTPADPEAAVSDEIRNWFAYGKLIYGHQTEAAVVFEKLIRAMRCVAVIYADHELNAAANAAQHSLEQNARQELSPNQRRILLKPLRELIRRAAAYAQILPERTGDAIGAYCAAVQVALYAAALFDRPREHYDSLNAVIQGQSLRDLAKQHGIKTPELRIHILNAAWCLYRIAECFQDIEQAKSIPELRRAEWQPYGRPETLKTKIAAITEKWLHPFEEHTGFTLLAH